MAAPGLPPLKREPLLDRSCPPQTRPFSKGAREVRRLRRMHRRPSRPLGVVTAGSFHLHWKGSRLSFSKLATVSSSQQATQFSSSTTPRGRPAGTAVLSCRYEGASGDRNAPRRHGQPVGQDIAAASGQMRRRRSAASRRRETGTAEVGGFDAPWRDTVRGHKLIAHFARAQTSEHLWSARRGASAITDQRNPAKTIDRRMLSFRRWGGPVADRRFPSSRAVGDQGGRILGRRRSILRHGPEKGQDSHDLGFAASVHLSRDRLVGRLIFSHQSHAGAAPALCRHHRA